MQRVLPWFAIIAAALIGIFAAVELRARWDESEIAAPTLQPSATELPTPAPDETPGEETEPPTPETADIPTPTATIMAMETATAEPTAEPTVAPTDEPASPTPEPTGEPMPHTGGGAVGGGLAVFALAAMLGAAVRRSYSTRKRS